MKALEQTGGELYSFDIKKNVAEYTRALEIGISILFQSRNKVPILPKSLKTGKLIYGSMMDSYMWQNFEHNLAFSRLAENRMIVSHDMDASETWIQFCAVNPLESACVFDNRKTFGIAKRKVS